MEYLQIRSGRRTLVDERMEDEGRDHEEAEKDQLQRETTNDNVFASFFGIRIGLCKHSGPCIRVSFDALDGNMRRE